MNLNDKYAVVDLEVSRPFKKGGEIIQFAVTFVKNWEIIDSFSTLINPGHKIDWQVKKLTGIHNSDVKDKPYFEEVAPQIVQLLQESVFVAHNAPFDWQFLNDSLQRAGFSKLNNPVIDTVQLSQIAIPKSSSFKLTNLVNDLNIPLATNHHANDDADMTANLLIELKKIIEKLPKIVLNNFKQRNFDLIGDNQNFLTLFDGQILTNNQRTLEDKIVISKRLTTDTSVDKSESVSYPIDQNEKIQLFDNQIVLRSSQAIFMDAVYFALTDPTPNEFLVINSPKYLGKTLGFLLPSLIEVKTNHNKILIYVADKKQRQHLINEIDNKLDLALDLRTHYFNIGGLSNIIDVNTILNILSSKTELDKDRNLFLARLLVWLIDTETGNFDDFQSKLNKSIYQEFGVSLESKLDSKNPFYEVAVDTLNQSEIIILDHSNFDNLELLTDNLKTKQLNVIVDNAEKLNRQSVDFNLIKSSMPIFIYSKSEDHDLKIVRKTDFEPI